MASAPGAPPGADPPAFPDVFEVRLNTIDYYLAEPVPGLDETVSPFRGDAPVKQVRTRANVCWHPATFPSRLERRATHPRALVVLAVPAPRRSPCSASSARLPAARRRACTSTACSRTCTCRTTTTCRAAPTARLRFCGVSPRRSTARWTSRARGGGRARAEPPPPRGRGTGLAGRMDSCMMRICVKRTLRTAPEAAPATPPRALSRRATAPAPRVSL